MTDQHGQEGDLVSVFSAPDEATANIVAGLLESEGIPAAVQSGATVWGGQAAVADSIQRRQESCWGDVLVTEADAANSREIIAAYSPKEGVQPGQQPASPWALSYTPGISLRLPCTLFAVLFGLMAYFGQSGNIPGLLSVGITGGLMALPYGVYMVISRKYVPDVYRPYHNQVGYGLLAAACILTASWIAALGTSMSLTIIALVCGLCAAGFAYGAVRSIPVMTPGDQPNGEDIND